MILGSSPGSYSNPLHSSSSSFDSKLRAGSGLKSNGAEATGSADDSAKHSAFADGNGGAGTNGATANGNGSNSTPHETNGNGGSHADVLRSDDLPTRLGIRTGSSSSRPLHVTVEGGSPRGASPRFMNESVVQPTSQPFLATQVTHDSAAASASHLMLTSQP